MPRLNDVVTRWVPRMFDDRFARGRMVVLGLGGVAFLVLQRDDRYEPVDWFFAAVAIALCPVAWRWPFVASLAGSLTYGVAANVGVAEPMVPEVGATFMLLEVALREPGRRIGIAAGGMVAAHVADIFPHLPGALGHLAFDLVVTVGLPLLVGANIRGSRRLARQAEHRATAEAQAARVGERAAIARELHDLVAHHVASMVLRVGVARHVLPVADPRVTEVFDDLHATGTTALADLRRLVALLRDPTADASAYAPIDPGALPDALATTVERATRAGLTVEATIDPAVATLDAVRGLAVLRLTQEGLTNVARHAGASATATLTVRVRADAVHWELTDDGGRGDVLAVPNGGPGHGLVGMRERVEVLGGSLTAGPSGAGWRLATVLPAGVGA
ncbi:sensor histidine kinase [Virgisporangium ochraceum]|uniref:histidine kinase n=1 Tax=Virgisporangium ochraceum TaxID=65505 RepID=A0A8J4E9G1_9ACTN|nr:histidine kinase [Virgisporangium ochraceum]GIJ67195.1 two-component sensor histidine kinase [Virgisporangium ochraceum]